MYLCRSFECFVTFWNSCSRVVRACHLLRHLCGNFWQQEGQQAENCYSGLDKLRNYLWAWVLHSECKAESFVFDHLAQCGDLWCSCDQLGYWMCCNDVFQSNWRCGKHYYHSTSNPLSGCLRYLWCFNSAVAVKGDISLQDSHLFIIVVEPIVEQTTQFLPRYCSG